MAVAATIATAVVATAVVAMVRYLCLVFSQLDNDDSCFVAADLCSTRAESARVSADASSDRSRSAKRVYTLLRKTIFKKIYDFLIYKRNDFLFLLLRIRR